MAGIIKPKGLVEAQLVHAGIGQDYYHVDFPNYQGPDKAKKATIRYLKELEVMKQKGIGLMYVGPPGPGKTTAAMICMKYLVRANWTVFCTSLGEIVEQIQKSWGDKGDDRDSEEFLNRCRRADFLYIDDVGKEHRGQSGFVPTVFDNLIRYRVQHRLPTFLSTNLTQTELEGNYGEAVMSLIEGKVLPITVLGDDYRRTVQKQENRRDINGG